MYHQQTDTPGNPSVSKRGVLELNQRPGKEPLKQLTEEDWTFWLTNGYVVIPNAVPLENLDAVTTMLWDFQEMKSEDPATWYHNPANEIQMTELKNSGMVEVYNHQSMWNNRQNPRVYNAFVDIWGRKDLWVTIDRANLNVPSKPGWEFQGFIHWDIDTSLDPLSVNVQGVLALNDTTEEMGGFQCVPGLFREFPKWVKSQPADRDPWQPDLDGFKVERVSSRAGDLLIWNSLLAHGIRPNHSDTPRLAQYISMAPAQEDNQELKGWRIQSWQDRIAPTGYPFPGDPRETEKKKFKTAELTSLGEKLLGLESWYN